MEEEYCNSYTEEPKFIITVFSCESAHQVFLIKEKSYPPCADFVTENMYTDIYFKFKCFITQLIVWMNQQKNTPSSFGSAAENNLKMKPATLVLGGRINDARPTTWVDFWYALSHLKGQPILLRV